MLFKHILCIVVGVVFSAALRVVSGAVLGIVLSAVLRVVLVAVVLIPNQSEAREVVLLVPVALLVAFVLVGLPVLFLVLGAALEHLAAPRAAHVRLVPTDGALKFAGGVFVFALGPGLPATALLRTCAGPRVAVRVHLEEFL